MCLFEKLLIAISIWISFALFAAEPAVVSNIKIMSDKVDDVSSFDAMKRSKIKDGMSDEQKVLALWNIVVKFRHHDINAEEHLSLAGSQTMDAIKLFNVYGYCNGTEAQSAFIQLARQLGYEARGWSLYRWDTSEVSYGGAWHMIDPGFMCYLRKPAGSIASVSEIRASVKDWYEKNPGYLNNSQKIDEFHARSGHSAGPEVLANCPTYDHLGKFALNWFGWSTLMMNYNGMENKPILYEEAASCGYRVNIQLRRGERLIRNWEHKGLFIPEARGRDLGCLKAPVGKGPLYYTPKLGDLANGRLGNGTLEYEVPVNDTDIRNAFLSTNNIALKCEDKLPGSIHVKDAAQQAELVLRMPSSYVYLTGLLEFESMVGNGGSVVVYFSDNHGRDWTEISKSDASSGQTTDLSKYVLRRYDFRLKFVLSGKGTGINRLKVSHDIQHSQRALPALDKGDNNIQFNAGPQEGTITIEGAGLKFKGKQVTYEELGAVLTNIDKDKIAVWNAFVPYGETGDITFPVETPGDFTRLRMGCSYRAEAKEEGWDFQVSFNDGKSFETVARAPGLVRAGAKWISFDKIPPNTRKALVRFSGANRSGCALFRHRIDADYIEPQGGFAPIKVTYLWNENGQAKESIHIAKSPEESYTIHCEQKPVLKSIILEHVGK
jgi:hypothetical protein